MRPIYPLSDYLDAEIEFIQDSIYNNETEIKAAQHKFGNLLQLPDKQEPIALFEDSLHTFQILHFDTTKILKRALLFGYDENFNLKELELSIEMKKAKANIFPHFQLDLGGGFNTQFENIKQMFDGRSSSFNVLLTISVPLYNGDILKNKYKMAQLQMQKLNEDRIHQKSTATINILKELSNVNITVQSINNQKKLLSLVAMQMENVTLSIDYGRLNVEQYIRLKSQYSQTM